VPAHQLGQPARHELVARRQAQRSAGASAVNTSETEVVEAERRELKHDAGGVDREVSICAVTRFARRGAGP